MNKIGNPQRNLNLVLGVYRTPSWRSRQDRRWFNPLVLHPGEKRSLVSHRVPTISDSRCVGTSTTDASLKSSSDVLPPEKIDFVHGRSQQ